MQWHELENQPCSVARTLSVIGDRWTLLVLRECFLRVRRFDDFQERLGIGRPILTDRLKKLVDAFVLTKVAYQTNPMRYEYRLTQKGLDLHPVVMAIVHWGDVHMVDKKGRPLIHRHT
ncbi:helix-turn-helix domain-containing protein, partial [Phenylobacterium sp.]|uniref:winged helix-turn-helix transcriptional regulator n=1 Tax=Phenylobacterium sp. TaxID=1871053 RepID=UPI0027363CAC